MSGGPGDVSDDLKSSALFYHRNPRPGKLEVQPTKPLGNQRDLALAYTPGVATACETIAADPAEAATLTVRQNLVGVVTNGTAVLGLGDIGPLASKPVMEGKAVLFKKFAGIDVFDIEVAERGRPAGRCGAAPRADLSGHQPRGHQGAGVLRGRGAPQGPHGHPGVPRRPAWHRDHRRRRGVNALELAGKRIEEVKIVTSGAGARRWPASTCWSRSAPKRENIWITDIEGVVYQGREKLMDRWKAVYAQQTRAHAGRHHRGADIFLGLSAGGVLKPALLEKMAPAR
jgi:malate dehydrogenase (oxaloacetate-decarboxylating)(NADP+)